MDRLRRLIILALVVIYPEAGKGTAGYCRVGCQRASVTKRSKAPGVQWTVATDSTVTYSDDSVLFWCISPARQGGEDYVVVILGNGLSRSGSP